MNHDHLLHDAKQAVLSLHEKGYHPPVREKIPVVGETGYATLLLGAKSMKVSGYISDHDFTIAKKLAFCIAGGKVPYGTEVDEQYLLNIEREAFLSLVTSQNTKNAAYAVKGNHYATKFYLLKMTEKADCFSGQTTGHCAFRKEEDQTMKEAVIVAGARTPVGKAKKGTLKDMRPDDLGALVVKETIKRAGNYEGNIDDLIIGCAMPEAEQGMNMARNIGALAGLPYTVPAITINRYCSSGLQTIAYAAEKI